MNKATATPSFWSLSIKNFLGYFIFFVTPTAASDYWDQLLNGVPGSTLSESEKSLRRRAFWFGMALGPFLLFFLSLLLVAKILGYF